MQLTKYVFSYDIPDAWMVKYLHYDKQHKFITLEKSRAIEYAETHHGTIHPLFLIEPVMVMEVENEVQAL